MDKKEKNTAIPKEVLDAWQVVAKYLHKNRISSLWLDVELDNGKRVTKGKFPFVYQQIVFNFTYILKDLQGFNLSSRPIRIREDYYKNKQKNIEKD